MAGEAQFFPSSTCLTAAEARILKSRSGGCGLPALRPSSYAFPMSFSTAETRCFAFYDRKSLPASRRSYGTEMPRTLIRYAPSLSASESQWSLIRK